MTELDDHFGRFGAELRRVDPHGSGPRHRRPRRRPLLLAGGVATLGAAALALTSIPLGSSPIDVVSEARAALTAPDQILHYSVQMERGDGFDGRRHTPSVERCTGKPSELWRTTSGALRWRMLNPLAPCAIGLGSEGRISTGDTELAYAGDTLTSHAVGDGWMTVRTQTRPVDARIPWEIGMPIGERDEAGTDPVDQLRALLADGKLRAEGTRRDRDGRLLRRLVNRHRASVIKGEPWRPVTVEYFVDAETFVPVVVRSTRTEATGLDRAGRRTSRTRFRTGVIAQRFGIFERIPLTEASEHLLAVHAPIGTDVLRSSTPEWLRALKARNRSRLTVSPSRAESRRADARIQEQIRAGIRPAEQWTRGSGRR